MNMLRHAAFVTNPLKAESNRVCDLVCAIAREQGIAYSLYTLDEISGVSLADTDLLIVIGGDGTLLKAAGCAARFDIPVLAVNLGRLGFLSEILPEQFSNALITLREGKASIESRMMLHCSVNDGAVQNDCVNDILLYKRSFSGVTHIGIEVDDLSVGNVFCDGLIVSTPTGATGYSISAGGPIIAPGLDAAIITPVCAHSLYMRPIVAASDAKMEFTMHSDGCLYSDGQYVCELKENDRITITKADTCVRFVRIQKQNLYALIHQKLT